MSDVRRPAVRFLGGKFRMAEKLIRLFPHHRHYTEVFGGGANVLLRKARSYAEVYNDLDKEMVNLFRVLRDEAQSEKLIRGIALTPFAREEFELCYEMTDDPVERARRTVARSFMGHGSNAANIARKTGFRADSSRSGTSPSMDWANFPPELAKVARRMRGVVIENRDAKSILARFDKPATLHYIDPPYVQSTRCGKKVGGELYNSYAYEMTDDQHVELLAYIRTLQGMVILSGYAHPIYDEGLAGWERSEIGTYADGARPRTEIVWRNPAAVGALGLFGDER